MATEQKKDHKIIFFKSGKEWRKWLDKNHHVSPGIWMRFYKKNSVVVSVKYQEALIEALCFGWIDGQAKSLDEDSYLQKFTPRRPKSMWSKRNIEIVTNLESEGLMKPAGLKAVQAAKEDGRWESAYDSPSKMTFPDDFLSKLKKNKKMHAFFESLNKTNKYAIAWRLQTAKKPETRERRMKLILEMLKKGEKFH
jgi:uncharacterized protein YdeI (YjbR/CyaY-like superfamily)